MLSSPFVWLQCVLFSVSVHTRLFFSQFHSNAMILILGFCRQTSFTVCVIWTQTLFEHSFVLPSLAWDAHKSSGTDVETLSQSKLHQCLFILLRKTAKKGNTNTCKITRNSKEKSFLHAIRIKHQSFSELHLYNSISAEVKL